MLSSSQLLDLWEQALNQSPVEQALTLVAAISPDSSRRDLAELPIGQRDLRLLNLREVLFGPQVEIVSRCPACSSTIESTFRVSDIRNCNIQTEKKSLSLEAGGFQVKFRVPSSCDLLMLPSSREPIELCKHLIAYCVLEARDANGDTVESASLPSSIIAKMSTEMALADPLADIELGLTCPTCAHEWEQAFNIADLLWKEIHAWAQRTLRDVHSLSLAYGWREVDVLALTPTRRQIYLELIQA
jgi:hypothetical protein